MDYKNKTIIWGVLFTGALIVHFWPMACWSGTAIVLLRVIAAFSAQMLSFRMFKSSGLKLLPLLLTVLLALWGGWLFATSPAWANATFFGYVLDYCSPALACAVVCLSNIKH